MRNAQRPVVEPSNRRSQPVAVLAGAEKRTRGDIVIYRPRGRSNRCRRSYWIRARKISPSRSARLSVWVSHTGHRGFCRRPNVVQFSCRNSCREATSPGGQDVELRNYSRVTGDFANGGVRCAVKISSANCAPDVIGEVFRVGSQACQAVVERIDGVPGRMGRKQFNRHWAPACDKGMSR